MTCPQCKAKLQENLLAVQNCSYCHTLLLSINSELSTLKCKGCSAPLQLEGELSQSKILICSYCSTAMDSENEFKKLYSFKNIQAPNTMLEVGMKGHIDGKNYSIISLTVYKSRGIEWLDFTLYSDKGDYVKLIKKEDKYLFFNKRVKEIEANIWLLKKEDTFNFENKKFEVESFYFTEIYFAVGSIDSKINKNQRNKQCFAKSKDSWFYSSYSVNDIIYYLGNELDEVEVFFSF